MKPQDCCTGMKECATALWQKAKKPTVKQTFHYDVGIYPDAATPGSKNALRLHLGGTHSCPLWKLILVAAVALITLAVTLKCKFRDE